MGYGTQNAPGVTTNLDNNLDSDLDKDARIAELQYQSNTLLNQRDQLRARVAELENNIAAQTYNLLLEERDTLRKQVSDITSMWTEACARVEELGDNLEEWKEFTFSANQREADLTTQLAAVAAERGKLIIQTGMHEEWLSSYKERLDDLGETTRSLSNSYFKVQQERDFLMAELAATTAERDENAAHYGYWQNEAMKASEELAAYKQPKLVGRTWQINGPRATCGSVFTSRGSAEAHASGTQIGYLRRDTYSDGSVKCELEPV